MVEKYDEEMTESYHENGWDDIEFEDDSKP
jgi:hypothetical protein